MYVVLHRSVWEGSLQPTKQWFKPQSHTKTWESTSKDACQRWRCGNGGFSASWLTVEGRMAEIRGKKPFMADPKQVFAATQARQLSLHPSSNAKKRAKAWPPQDQGFGRLKQPRITTAAPARNTGLTSLGRLAVLDTIFQGLIRCVCNVLCLSGIRGGGGGNILKEVLAWIKPVLSHWYGSSLKQRFKQI